MRIRQTQKTEWAPHWETFDGVVYMTEKGGAKGTGRQQVGALPANAEEDMTASEGVAMSYSMTGSVKALGSSGADSLEGDKDLANLLHGMANDDEITGGAMSDILLGGRGSDRIHAGGGNDTVNGGAGNDEVYGGAGNDYVRGGGGDDTVTGGSGNDRVDGGKGNDTLHGGDGHDFLYGSHGTDIMYGGAGDDLFYLKQISRFDAGRFDEIYQQADSIKDFEQGHDKIRINTYTDVAYQNVTVGDDDFTVIFNHADSKGGVYGVIDNQDVDLTVYDFKNARSVTELDAVAFDSWDDVSLPLFDPMLIEEPGIF